MICLTKSRSEFGIVSGTLGMFMDSFLSTGSLANWSQVLLSIKAVHSNQSRCRTELG